MSRAPPVPPPANRKAPPETPPETHLHTLQNATDYDRRRSSARTCRSDRHVRARKGLGRYLKGKVLGQGAFGTVYQGIDQLTGQFVAIKEIAVENLNTDDEVRNEFDLLQTLSHENIVRYIDYEFAQEGTRDMVRIYLEYVEGGSLASVLSQYGRLSEPVIRAYSKQVLLGLQYLHSKGVMHRDIKPANLLVSCDASVKLADFGASKKIADGAEGINETKFVGTPAYIAPEAIQGKHTFLCDIWSVGCTLVELATAKPPWTGAIEYSGVVDFIHKVASTDAVPPIPNFLSDEFYDFVEWCLQRDPSKRGDVNALLDHIFLIPIEQDEGDDGEEVEEEEGEEEEEEEESPQKETEPAMSTMDALFKTSNIDSTHVDLDAIPPIRETNNDAPPPEINSTWTGRKKNTKSPGSPSRATGKTAGGAMMPPNGWFTSTHIPSPKKAEPEVEVEALDLCGMFMAAHHCNDMVAKGFFEAVEARNLWGGDDAVLRADTTEQLELVGKVCDPLNSPLDSPALLKKCVSVASPTKPDSYLTVNGTPDGLISINIPEMRDGQEAVIESPRTLTVKYDVFFNEKTTPKELFLRIGVPVLRSMMKAKTTNKKVSIVCTGMPYSGKTQTVIGSENIMQESKMGMFPLIIKYLFDNFSKTHNFHIASMCTRKEKTGMFDNLGHRVVHDIQDWSVLRKMVLHHTRTWEEAIQKLDLSKLAFLGVKMPYLFVIEATPKGSPDRITGTLFVSLFYGRQWTYWLNGITGLINTYFSYANGMDEEMSRGKESLSPLTPYTPRDDNSLSKAAQQPAPGEWDSSKYTNEFFSLVEQVYKDDTSMNYVLHNFHGQQGHVDEVVSSLLALESAVRGAHVNVAKEDANAEE